MGRANQMDPNRGVTEEALGVVDEGLGTAYDVVRSVYDSLAGINIVAENIAVITDANETLEALEEAIALIGSTAADAASALASKNAAAASAVTASTASTNATNRAAEALANATASGISAAAALVSQNAASASQTTATSQAGIATTKAAEALASANTASGHVVTATTKASEALASAIAAATSETAAINAKILTESARDATFAAFDSFDDRYLGDKAIAPTVDNDGNTLVAGSLYFDTSIDPGSMKVYTGPTYGWVAAYVTGDGFAPLNHDHDTRYYTKAISDGRYAAIAHVGSGGAAHADVVAAGASGFMTGAMATKLNGISSGATANSADATLLARANHTGSQTADTIVDGTTNKAFTGTEKTKLSGIATGATANSSDATLLARANHTGTQAITTATFTTTSRVAGRVTAGSGIVEELTGAQVTALLSTVIAGGAQGVMSGVDKTKLDGVATGATANSSDATLLNRANHTGTQSADTLTNGATNGAFLLTERTKLTGIATGATANSADATLLARANHTGTQPISSIRAANSSRIFGRVTASGGAGEELTAAQVRTLINVANGANVGTITGSFGSGGTTGLTLTGGASTGSVTLTIGGTLALASGGTGSTTAVGARTNLGATSVGHNFFILTNPSAITFPRINADNTVTALSAAAFLTAIGGGAGTITAINGSGGTSGLTLTGGASSGSVTLTIGGTLSTANGGTGINAFGTGVAAALGIAVGSAGAFVTFNGAGGTPSAINLTNGTALPIGGITGLGTNVATKLAAANLGASTVGNNFHTMTNPSAITFPRMNADNTVSALNASNFRTAIGITAAIDGDNVNTSESRANAAYGDLTTVGPVVTMETGSEVFIDISAMAKRTSAISGGDAFIAVEVSGATTITAVDANGVFAAGQHTAAATGFTHCLNRRFKLTGLTPGSNTFTLKYKTSGASYNYEFINRSIVVERA